MSHAKIWISFAAAAALLGGCVLKPAGTDEHRGELTKAGEVYQKPVGHRNFPELPQPTSWQDVLRRALLANGELESAYWEWNAAVAKIDQEAAYPNSNVNLGFDYMFSGESMKAWDRTTLSAEFDQSTGGLLYPGKIKKAGEIALAEAKAKSQQFRGRKFAIQREALTMFYELALAEEKVRIGEANLSLLNMLQQNAAARVQTGGMQQELLRMQVEYRVMANELTQMRADAEAARAQLNGLLARDAKAPLILANTLPQERPLTVDDATLIAAGVAANPELAALAHEVKGRENAIERARMEYILDISPTAAITGNVTQALGAMVMVPTNIPKIRGMIQEQRAMLHATSAMARQKERTSAAQFVAELYLLRNAQERRKTLEQQILPAVERMEESAVQSYAAGMGGFLEVIDAYRAWQEARLTLAEARMDREMRLANLEELAGIDIETLTATAATK